MSFFAYFLTESQLTKVLVTTDARSPSNLTVAKSSGFKAEKVLAFMFVLSALMLIAVPIVDRIGAIPQTQEGETVADAMRRASQEVEEKNTMRPVANLLFYSGIAGVVITLGAGLVIALGIGPAWMSRSVRGMIVRETFADDGTNKYFTKDPPQLKGLRYYARVALSDDTVTEYIVDKQLYRRLQVGDKLNAKVIGRRIVELE